MITVYKYPIDIKGDKVTLPKGAEVLSVNIQQLDICLWVKVNTKEVKMEIRTFKVYGTGHMIPHDNHSFIGTLWVKGGFVFHVFEVK